MDKKYQELSSSYLEHLCHTISNRHPGSPGNQQATHWLAEKLLTFNWEIENQKFDCIDWESGPAQITIKGLSFDLKSGPYTLPFNGKHELISVENLPELENKDIKNKIVILSGEIAAGQLFPKNFVFYNPDEHKKIYRILEEKVPAAIIAATGKNPEVAGSVYPFPMFEDGDFDIPNAYMKDIEGEKLKKFEGKQAELKIRSKRIPGEGENIIARKVKTSQRIVLTAHIDAKKNTPGALDNASGIIVLLLAAEMLKDLQPSKTIEIAFLNGEDYYAASGEMEYISKLNNNWQDIELCVNIDAAGCRGKKVAVSNMLCSEELLSLIDDSIGKYSEIIPGEPWYIGDHMIFAQKNVPVIAISSENLLELCRDVTHTPVDDLEMVDPALLVQTAEFITELCSKLT